MRRGLLSGVSVRNSIGVARSFGLTCSIVVITGIALGAVSSMTYAETSYPTSPEITTEPLDQTRRDLLRTVIDEPLDDIKRKRVLDKLCPLDVSQSPMSDESARRALPIVENTLATDILFARPDDPSITGPRQFSFLVEFSLTRVVLQHSLPRFPGDAPGQAVIFPSAASRGVWLQGKLGTDMFVLVPSVRECGARAVVLCPRAYKPEDKLADSKFTPKAARVLVTAKADGIFSNPAGTTAKVVASIRATKNIRLPREWSNSVVGPKDPEASVKVVAARNDRSQWPPFSPLTLPWLAAVESRTDFGTEALVYRSSSRTTSVEISEYQVKEIPAISVGYSEYSVEGGTCYLVAEWTKSSL